MMKEKKEVIINGRAYVLKKEYDVLLLALEMQEIRIKALEKKIFKGCKQ